MVIADSDFNRLQQFVRERYGVNLEKKRALVEGRLSNYLQAEGFAGFHDYINAVLSDTSGEMVNILISKLTTNYTYFMREEAHYRFMSGQALPEWTERVRHKDLRIWSAGCSTGEEAYTAAMVVQEFLGQAASSWDATILATDISLKVLAQAREATYPDPAVFERLPDHWRSKYFQKLPNGHWKASDLLRNQVVFAQFNLMDPFSVFKKKFHIIFCRNVMIYFNTPTKQALIEQFYDALEPGGYFFIGMSETLSGLTSRFEQIAPSIYRKGTPS